MKNDFSKDIRAEMDTWDNDHDDRIFFHKSRFLAVLPNKELAEKIIELTDSNSKIIYKPLPSDDPIKRRPDLTLARKELNYEPRIQLEEGLEKTIDYFKGILQ